MFVRDWLCGGMISPSRGSQNEQVLTSGMLGLVSSRRLLAVVRNL